MVKVALHPEGVDRNLKNSCALRTASPSPSTRRAWIEIKASTLPARDAIVALHPEGVDRNTFEKLFFGYCRVALHPEGVDRNTVQILENDDLFGRPPPGGRG